MMIGVDNITGFRIRSLGSTVGDSVNCVWKTSPVGGTIPWQGFQSVNEAEA